MKQSSSRRFSAAAAGAPLLLALLAVGILFFVGMGVKALKEKTPDPVESSTEAASGLPSGTTEQAASTEAFATETLPTQALVTTEVTEPPTTEAPPRMMTVDDGYFYDALFIGDSRTDGLWLYSTPGACKHYSGTSMNIYKLMDSEEEAYGFKGLRNLLQGMQFGKIYLMLGINECGYSTASFSEKYKSVVEEIRSYQPDAIIYLQSILYVTQQHETNYPVFSTANIKEKNATIEVLANGVDTFYLEVNDALNDGTDHLPAEYTGDGVHLYAKYYQLWHDYLLEHAVVDAKHPWEPDSTEPVGAEAEHP